MPSPEAYLAAASVAAVGTWMAWKLRDRPTRPAPSVRALGDLLEELRKTSRAMAESMDRRAAELKVLIAEADRRIEAMKRQPAPAGLVPPPPQVASIPDVGSDVSPEMKAVFDTVYEQADQGRAVTDIARETGLNKTAVTLILGLREMHRPRTEDAAPGRSGAPR